MKLEALYLIHQAPSLPPEPLVDLTPAGHPIRLHQSSCYFTLLILIHATLKWL
jgi:hypothetical protein